MSNYITKARLKGDKGWKTVEMLDDFFDKHVYGVRFPNGKVYREDKCYFHPSDDITYNRENTITHPSGLKTDPMWENKLRNKLKREFESGSIRDTDEGKLCYRGFINPLCDFSFAQYMHKHRKMTDGTLRKADNWQKGMPQDVLMDSLIRHVEDLKLLYQGYPIVELRTETGTEKVLADKMTEEEFKERMIDTLNAIRFNSEAIKLQLL